MGMYAPETNTTYTLKYQGEWGRDFFVLTFHLYIYQCLKSTRSSHKITWF